MDSPADNGTETMSIGQLVVDARDPGGLAAWWQELLGGGIEVDDDGDVRLHGGAVPLLFVRVPDTATGGKNRLHLDLRCDDYAAARQLAIDLGATPADDVFVTDRWRVFRDPEGNEFCIIRP